MSNLTGSVAGNISLSGGGSGTDDYNDLSNKPSINSVTLTGNKTSSDLNINYNSLPDQPSINGITLIGNKTSADLNITASNDYDDLTNKPQINGVPLTGNKTSSDLNINIITDYDDLSDKPSINGVALTGNKTSSDLNISDITDYDDLSDKPQINGVTLAGNKTTSDLNINIITDYDDLTDKPQINGVALTGNKTTSDLNINIITDYDDLTDKPSINNVTLTGNKTTSDLNLASADITYDNTTSGLSASNVQSAIDELDTSVDTNKSDITSIKDIYEDVTASGAIASFTGIAALPITSGKFYINAVQSGTGTPSPDNIRPITGFSTMGIFVKQHNLLGRFSGNWQNSTLINDSGVEVANTYMKCSSDYLSVSPSTNYVFQANKTIATELTVSVVLYDDNKNFISRAVGSSLIGTGIVYVAFTTPNNCKYLRFNVPIYSMDYQLEYGTTPSNFEPYNASQTISFGSTIYGGYYNSVTGKLVSTYGNIASYNGEVLPGAWISSMDEYAEGTTPTTGAQVVYELATPTETDISATCIIPLEETNNIYHNCNGNTEVTAFKQNTIIPGLEKVLQTLVKYL